MGRTLVGKWRWGGPWWGVEVEVEVGRTLVGKWRWGGGGGADPGGEVGAGEVGLSLIPTPRYPHPPVETNH